MFTNETYYKSIFGQNEHEPTCFGDRNILRLKNFLFRVPCTVLSMHGSRDVSVVSMGSGDSGSGIGNWVHRSPRVQ